MNILIIIISLFLGFFTQTSFAQETNEIVIIDSVATEGVYVGQTFPVSVSIIGADPDTIFFYKFYGGLDNTLSSIQTNESLTYNSSWDQFPTITTDGDGNAYIETSAYLPANLSSGIYNLYVRLAYPNLDSPLPYKSSPQDLSVFSIPNTPTPTPNQTSTPTPTPNINTLNPTNTPNPTNIPITTSTPNPTNTPTPTPDMKIFGTIDISTESATLSSDNSLISSPEASDSTYIETGSNPIVEVKSNHSPKKNNFIALVLIIFGASLFIFPLMLRKIKFKSRCLKK